MSRIVLSLVLGFLSAKALAADRVIVVTATAGFRHDSIETAEGVIAEIAARSGFEVSFVRTQEEMPGALSADTLRTTRLVMFVNTTGEIGTASRPGLLQWVRQGGSFIGVHSASDTWHDSAEYVDMLGGEFNSHPAQTAVDVYVDDSVHLATFGLESPYEVFEEIYLFKNFHLERVKMLLSLRASPEVPQAGFYPLSWTRSYGQGRVLYTALGHRIDVWTSPWFRQHLSGAISWGLRRDIHPRRRAVRR